MNYRGSFRFSGLAIVAAVFVLLLLPLTTSGQEDFSKPTPTPTAQDEDFSKPKPTQTPPTTDKAKELFRKMREQQEATLNQHGPQPNPTSETGSFSMMAFVHAGWPLVVEYELEEGAVAYLSLVTLNDRGMHLFNHRLEGIDIGDGAKRDVVKVPDEFGALQPGDIYINARIKTPTGSRKANFKLHGLGVGVPTLHPPGQVVGERQVESFSFINTNFELSFPQQSVLRDLVIRPDVINTAQGQLAEYTFRPAQTFGQWAADFSIVTRTVDSKGVNVTKSKRVNYKEFNSEIREGSEVSGNWDGKNFRGQFSKGLHKIAVRAWWTAASAGAGASCYRNSNQEFTIQ